VVDTGGILFTLAGLAQPVNLFSTPQGQFGIYLGGGNFPNDFPVHSGRRDGCDAGAFHVGRWG